MNAPPYTVTKLVTWRVKDWVSCFNACKLPLEEEGQSKTKNPEKTGVPREATTVKPKVGSNQKAKKQEEESSSSKVTKKKEIGDVSSRWPSFADDQDYIVFCFGDDGEVHVLPEKNSNVVGTSSSTNPRRLNLQQLLRLEDEAARNEKDSNGQVKGKEAGICSSSSEEIEEITEEEESGGELGREISRDSNDQSDAASSSSFAFPIIQGEWIGSPVQMPRPSQAQKPKNSLIHCCRF